LAVHFVSIRGKYKKKKKRWMVFGAQSELLNPQMLHVAVDRGRPVHASSKFGGLSHVRENFSIFFLFH
jgi:hypothetical protein